MAERLGHFDLFITSCLGVEYWITETRYLRGIDLDFTAAMLICEIYWELKSTLRF